jgi:putative hydrolase of the HAD superfamily
MESRRTFDVVLFDLGGTLIFFDGSLPEVMATQHIVLARQLKDLGYRLDEKEFAARFMQRMNAYYQERDTEFLEQAIETLLRQLLEEYGYENAPAEHLRPALNEMYAGTEAYWRAEDDTHATLQTLKIRGYRMGLISNANDSNDVQTLLDQWDLRRYFEIVLISADVRYRKPHPRIFRMALNHFHVEPQRAVMVGDTLGADVLGARNSGMVGVWIKRRAATPDNRDHLDTIMPDAIIETLSQLPNLLEKWPKQANEPHN